MSEQSDSLATCLRRLAFFAFLALLQLSQESRAQTPPPGRIQYIIVLDAGSTGTRLNAYKFQLDDSHSTGLKILDLRDFKISPGLSAYKNFPGRLRQALVPLLKFAADYVPTSYHYNTTAIVRATAGLRLLDPQSRAAVSRVVVEVLRKSSFLVPDADDRAVRVISGREEAEYGWVSVNFLLDTFDAPSGETYGMLDMGGGSTQITFVPRVDDPTDAYRIVFETVRGKTYTLHQHSYLGLGMSQAILSMIGHQASDPPNRTYTTPCLSPEYAGTFSFGSVSISVSGVENVTADERLALCLAAARRVLHAGAVHTPPSVLHSKFVAVSSFFYVSRQLSRMDPRWVPRVPGNVLMSDLIKAAGRMCAEPPSTGVYAPYLCMNLAHMVTLLRDGYRFSDDQVLYVADSINGYSAGWPLGLAIHYLTCHDPVIVRCLVPGSSRAKTAATASSWGLAVTVAEFLIPVLVNILA